MDDTNDAFAEAKNSSAKEIENLVSLAREAADIETSVVELDAALKEAKRRLNKLKTIDIPEEMAKIEMDEFALPDGVRIKVTDFVSGSLPKEPEKRETAIQWLDDNEAGSLLKTEVMVKLGRDDREEAKQIAESIRAAGFDPEVKENVHAATLGAFARERLKNGEDVPFDILGLYSGRVAKITLPKT